MTGRDLALGSRSVGSVCSGIGGLDLGFHDAGWDVAWQCEFDPWRRKMLAHHWPGVPCHDDLSTLDPAELAPVGVLIGGTPCQNFSQAGNRQGLAGAKSSLFHHYVRIRDAVQPEYCVWENVVGCLSTNDGNDFAAVLAALVGQHVDAPRGGWQRAGVAVAESGAWATWRVLDAQWFGVAQRRRRVIVVASTRAECRPEVLLEPEGVCWHPPTRGGSRSTVAIDAREGARSSGPEGGAVARCLTTSAQRIDADTETFVVGALTTGASDGGGWRIGADEAAANHIIPVAATLTSGSSNPGISAPGRRQEDDVNLVAFNWRGDDRAVEGRSHVPTLDADESGSIAVFAENQRGELVEGEVPTLNTGGGKPGQGYAALRDGLNVRRLTPLEYERLQGFPDGWTIDPDLGDKTPDSRRYAACGDAVAVPVAHWIANRIKEVGHVA